ncbi:MAG: hypothetical protein JEZ04_08865 [Spirochaetales bacterium]|nr:hypothetical protein [Spirochaetales bacterium]
MEINESDKIKASSFIQRLTANPALKSYSLLQREEQIMQFLTVNARQLFPTLSSPAFFAGRSWDEIWQVLIAVLYETTNEDLLPEIRNIISKIDLTFFTFLKNDSVKQESVNKMLNEMILRGLKVDQTRRVLSGALTAIKYDIVKKFIREVYRRNKYIHFELIKVERLKLGEKEAENMLSVTMLLRPLIYLFAPQGTVMKNTANGHVFLSQFTKNVAHSMIQKAPFVPEQVFLSAMNSNASFAEDRSIEATARMSNIFTAMCRNYKPEIKKDRGADTAQKSWINVARKNYRFYGYDIKMLDELYNIAADNSW